MKDNSVCDLVIDIVNLGKCEIQAFNNRTYIITENITSMQQACLRSLLEKLFNKQVLENAFSPGYSNYHVR